MSDIQTRAETWSQPISEAEPAGTNAEDVEEYMYLDMEMGKLQSIDSQIPDWDDVVRYASILLKEHTKDTAVISSLCVGLLYSERFAGLAAGFMAFDTVIQNYWDVMFPPARRWKKRAADYTRMLKYLERFIEEVPPQAGDHEAIKACLDNFRSLDGHLRERFGDMHPAVGPFTRVMEFNLKETEPSVSEAPPVEEGDEGEEAFAVGEKTDPSYAPQVTEAAAPVVSGSAALNISSIGSDAQAEQVVQQATKALSMASEYYSRRSEQLEEEKKRLEERLEHAGKIIEMNKNIEEMLTAKEEDEE